MDVDDLSQVYDAGIEALVDLALNEKPAQLTRELIYCRFPMNDGGGNSPELLHADVDAVESFISKQIPTMVYCSAGMSRSVAVVAAALATSRGELMEDTLLKLVSDQPHDVSPVLWSSIREVCAVNP